MTRNLILVLLLCLSTSGCVVKDGRVFFNADLFRIKPAPHVQPVKEHYLRVLIVEDSDKRSSLPLPKLAILQSKKVRDWMLENCSKGPNGEPDFRVFDYRADASGESKLWKDTLARSRPSNFWFYVENEKSGTEGPLPEDEDRFIDLLTPFASSK